MFRSSGRVQVRVWVGFDQKIYGFFGIDLFRVRIEEIVFKSQFSDEFKSDQFLPVLTQLYYDVAKREEGGK